MQRLLKSNDVGKHPDSTPVKRNRSKKSPMGTMADKLLTDTTYVEIDNISLTPAGSMSTSLKTIQQQRRIAKKSTSLNIKLKGCEPANGQTFSRHRVEISTNDYDENSMGLDWDGMRNSCNVTCESNPMCDIINNHDSSFADLLLSSAAKSESDVVSPSSSGCADFFMSPADTTAVVTNKSKRKSLATTITSIISPVMRSVKRKRERKSAASTAADSSVILADLTTPIKPLRAITSPNNVENGLAALWSAIIPPFEDACDVNNRQKLDNLAEVCRSEPTIQSYEEIMPGTPTASRIDFTDECLNVHCMTEFNNNCDIGSTSTEAENDSEYNTQTLNETLSSIVKVIINI